jgi:hypothetical protein
LFQDHWDGINRSRVGQRQGCASIGTNFVRINSRVWSTTSTGVTSEDRAQSSEWLST